MRVNSFKEGLEQSPAAVRSGSSLLSGLLRCGRCGRKLHVRYWGKNGAGARYLCHGDYEAGGRYCLGFGAGTIDRRFTEELLRVLSPLGLEASLAALERRAQHDSDEAAALRRQLEDLEYEARRAREQYDAVDPRYRLVAEELERRWEDKLAAVEQLRQALAGTEDRAPRLTTAERNEILALGHDFADAWHARKCPVELKKKIIRTVVEEIIVQLDESGQELLFTIHWKGGSHTHWQAPKPCSPLGRKTSIDDIEIIRRLAPRYTDAEIARVLNRQGRRTATGKRWNQTRVKSSRQHYAIPGTHESRDPELLSLAQAAAYTRTSDTTIRKLVESGLVENEQQIPWAPWEIRRSALDAPAIQSILRDLRANGKLNLRGNRSALQAGLFS